MAELGLPVGDELGEGRDVGADGGAQARIGDQLCAVVEERHERLDGRRRLQARPGRVRERRLERGRRQVQRAGVQCRHLATPTKRLKISIIVPKI